MTARRARRNDAAGHPHLAVACLIATMAFLGATIGSAYQGPGVLTWLFAPVAVGFGVLTWVALLPDGGPGADAESMGRAVDLDEDDVREDARQHADEDDPFGVIGGAP